MAQRILHCHRMVLTLIYFVEVIIMLVQLLQIAWFKSCRWKYGLSAVLEDHALSQSCVHRLSSSTLTVILIWSNKNGHNNFLAAYRNILHPKFINNHGKFMKTMSCPNESYNFILIFSWNIRSIWFIQSKCRRAIEVQRRVSKYRR